jgi:hypothetical protein
MDGLSEDASDPFVEPWEENAFLLSSDYKVENLSRLHPPLHILEIFRDIYVDRVDSLTKIIHVPTFWSTAAGALQNPHFIPKSVEALMFAFYLTTSSCMDDGECQQLLGESRSIVTSRYRLASRQALINASFMKTSSLMTLQAFTLFLVSHTIRIAIMILSNRYDQIGTKNIYPNASQFILSGVAVRLARRMGLHRDGTCLGLLPFETEMRRRLWWFIVQADYRTSHFSGSRPSTDLLVGDTKKPLNVEDEDMSPGMVEPPKERTGITSVVLCLVKYNVMEFLGKVSHEALLDMDMGRFSNSSLTLAEKETMISQFEDQLERRYLRYCDMSNALHYFTSIVARSSVCKMKLFAHNPRRYVNDGLKISRRERDIIFENGKKLLEYGNLVQSNPMLRKFKWQVGTGYLWDTLLYVLIEARNRKVGADVDRAWQLIGEVFSYYPQIFADKNRSLYGLYATFGNWTLQVWDDCVAAKRADGLPESPTPGYIAALRRSRRPPAKTTLESGNFTGPGGALGNLMDHNEIQPPKYDGSLFADFQPFETFDISTLPSFDSEPNEWAQWERLLSEQSF